MVKKFLDHFGAMISYYFYKGTSCQKKYIVDFENKANAQYFQVHQEAGWKVRWISNLSPIKVIWLFDIKEGQPAEFYSSPEIKLRQVRRLTLINLLPYLLLFLLFIFSFADDIKWHIDYGKNAYNLLIADIITQIFAILLLGFLFFRSIAYYLRMKKLLEKH